MQRPSSSGDRRDLNNRTKAGTRNGNTGSILDPPSYLQWKLSQGERINAQGFQGVGRWMLPCLGIFKALMQGRGRAPRLPNPSSCMSLRAISKESADLGPGLVWWKTRTPRGSRRAKRQYFHKGNTVPSKGIFAPSSSSPAVSSSSAASWCRNKNFGNCYMLVLHVIVYIL